MRRFFRRRIHPARADADLWVFGLTDGHGDAGAVSLSLAVSRSNHRKSQNYSAASEWPNIPRWSSHVAQRVPEVLSESFTEARRSLCRCAGYQPLHRVARHARILQARTAAS